jgi:chaperonin GroEL (HSP60 family)
LKNIQACKDISNMTKTSLGPNGMKKMVINHLDKIFVTSDAATVMTELEVQHPAAKMIVMASKMQEQECGDMTNFVITFAGELMNQAESLIKMGLKTSQVLIHKRSSRATKKRPSGRSRSWSSRPNSRWRTSGILSRSRRCCCPRCSPN